MYTSVRIRTVVKVVAIAMAMPRLISWRLVRLGLIGGCSVIDEGVLCKL